MLHREFPKQASEWLEDREGFSRRDFLKVMAASLALAGLHGGCTKEPQERIVPYGRFAAAAVATRAVVARSHHLPGLPTQLR